MGDLVDGIAAHFGLGCPTSHVAVEGGFSNRVLCVDTDRDRFAVKIFDRSLETNADRRGLEEAVEIELAAVADGVSAPEPVLDRRGQVLAELDGHLVRVHRWVVGWSPDSGPADASLAEQVGAWLADLHARRLPTVERAGSTVSAAPSLVWDRYAAASVARPWSPHLRAARPAIDALVELVAAAPVRGQRIGTHRDLFPRNALVTVSGLTVCDWDVAGSWTAAEELAGAAVDWSGGILGPVEPAPFLAVFDGYRAAGGTLPDADEALWAGYLAKQLDWLEMHVRRAILPPDAAARATAEHRLPFLLPRLVRQFGELPRWAALLRNHLGNRRPDALR